MHFSNCSSCRSAGWIDVPCARMCVYVWVGFWPHSVFRILMANANACAKCSVVTRSNRASMCECACAPSIRDCIISSIANANVGFHYHCLGRLEACISYIHRRTIAHLISISDYVCRTADAIATRLRLTEDSISIEYTAIRPIQTVFHRIFHYFNPHTHAHSRPYLGWWIYMYCVRWTPKMRNGFHICNPGGDRVCVPSTTTERPQHIYDTEKNTFNLCMIIFIRHSDPIPFILACPGSPASSSEYMCVDICRQTSTQAFFSSEFIPDFFRVTVFCTFLAGTHGTPSHHPSPVRMCNFPEWTVCRVLARSIVIFSRTAPAPAASWVEL